MLTKLIIRNFKQFDDVQIDLASAVVFIGPNNSGKTTALQALALWEAGCKQWLDKRAGASASNSAKGVTIVRKDLVHLPLPAADALWRDMKVRESYREDGKIKTRNILIDILVHGQNEQGVWECGFEFDYASEDFFYCRPLRLTEGKKPQRMPVPVEAIQFLDLAFLPPMTGLLMEEPLLQSGRINVLLGSGRSGETLRNLCYDVFQKDIGRWNDIEVTMQQLFGVSLQTPVFVQQTGSIELEYKNHRGVVLPLTSAGLGMLQTLLLLTYLSLRPRQLLLLDEPDAHLEILRQRQIYNRLVEMATRNDSQIVCASHSEVVLGEAIERDAVVAFVGKPHLVSGNKGVQVLKALRDWGFEHYMQAEQTGWVLYLEGSTDLAILRTWAEKMAHPAQAALARPFVHYLNCNVPNVARDHFNAIKEARPDVLGLAIFDRLQRATSSPDGLQELQWQRREIENYFATPEMLLAFAKGGDLSQLDLIELTESEKRVEAMRFAINQVEQATQILGEDLWSPDRKASEQVLPPIFARYLDQCPDVRVPSGKGDYYKLISYQPLHDIESEVSKVLDAIAEVHGQARRSA
ncbi:MAG: AAA family ATPase [Betaproteobacteria bacterium]|nr:AAA family ATPase [Betaproteobacteria bacterium]